MTDTAATLPGTGSDDSAVGTLTWVSPTNIQADDTNMASVFGNGGALTHYLKGANFGFSIPTNATINGITLEISRYASQNGALRYAWDNTVSLVIGGTVTGNNKAATSTKWPTTETPASYGGVSDLWGTTPAYSDINSSSFGIVMCANIYGASGATVYVDTYKVTITYTEAGTGGVTKQQVHYARLRS